MRELAIQAATDTLSDTERGLTDHEYQTMKNELDRIAQVTQFNGKKVLNGTNLAMDFQVGVGEDSADDRISMNTASFNATTAGLGVSGLSVGTKASAQNSIANIGMALDKLSSQRSLLGSIQNRLMVSSSNLDTYGLNMSASNSRIRDLDYAEEASKQARNSVVQSAATAVGAQANTQGSNALKLL
jgi:flagellin